MITRIEEIKLITRCVTLDDRRAFAKLVDEFSPGLRRFIFNLTLGDAALTDDIAQETFLKAYTSLRSFRGLARFRTWLYTIACRQLADYREQPGSPPTALALPTRVTMWKWPFRRSPNANAPWPCFSFSRTVR